MQHLKHVFVANEVKMLHTLSTGFYSNFNPSIQLATLGIIITMFVLTLLTTSVIFGSNISDVAYQCLSTI